MFSCTRDDPLRDRRSPPYIYRGGRFARRVGIGSDLASPAPGGTGPTQFRARPPPLAGRGCPVRDANPSRQGRGRRPARIVSPLRGTDYSIFKTTSGPLTGPAGTGGRSIVPLPPAGGGRTIRPPPQGGGGLFDFFSLKDNFTEKT